jgi:hypothetical protein
MRNKHTESPFIPILDAAQRNEAAKYWNHARLQKPYIISQNSNAFAWKRNSHDKSIKETDRRNLAYANKAGGLEHLVEQRLQSKVPSSRNPKLLYDLIAPVSTCGYSSAFNITRSS